MSIFVATQNECELSTQYLVQQIHQTFYLGNQNKLSQPLLYVILSLLLKPNKLSYMIKGY